MAVNLDIAVRIAATEASVLDHGTGVIVHELLFPGTLRSGSYGTGTVDNSQNRVFSDTRSLSSTSETLDLYGGLTDAFGVVINFVEVRGIYIKNTSTVAAATLLVGAGSNPSFAGLFGATGDIIKVPASGVFLWMAPLDGGGLTVTNTTADGLKIDSPSATVTYHLLIWGADA